MSAVAQPEAVLTAADLEAQLRADIMRFIYDPVGFTRFVFPWGKGDFRGPGSEAPRDWQLEILAEIRDHLKNPKTRFMPLQIARASGHGIGKSALIAMILAWAMSTCTDCRCIVTADTGAQLNTKTVPEVHKWFRAAINAHWFELNATSIRFRDPQNALTWRTDFLTWSEHNPEAFQGAHNKGKRLIIIYDEASAIATPIWEATEGALSDEDTEIIWIVFGNPTQNTGSFFEVFNRFKHRWNTRQIDSRDVEGTNKAQIEKAIEDYGVDSDFVRVRWRGMFPRSGVNQFISSDDVAAARIFRCKIVDELPKILALDVARFGDDQSCLFMRQGRVAKMLGKWREKDTVELADLVQNFLEKEDPDALVIDGDGLGGGVYDVLRHRGYGSILYEFHGAATAKDADLYYNRRTEIWGLARNAIAQGASIPDDKELATDLTGPQFGYSSQQQIQLEKKDDMKARGLASPDLADAYCMTYAVQLASRKKRKYQGSGIETDNFPTGNDGNGNPEAWMG